MRKLISQIKLAGDFLRRRPFISALLFISVMLTCTSVIVYYAEKNVNGANIVSLQDSLWWGLVTLLTIGYGDFYPVSEAGRIAAVFLMVSGVAAIAIVTAKVSSFFIEHALRERRGLVDTELLKNHFVICGWKEEMGEFLIHLLNTNKNFQAGQIVLLNNVSNAELEKLHAIPELRKIKSVKGEHFLEVNLKRVKPELAKKIMILADQTPNPNGLTPTLTEADARTIMTSMTLRSIAKGVPVAAEILDSSMDQYLRLAEVDEIIYSRSYSRMILAMASLGTGVTNVYHSLLDSKSPFFIDTHDIPEEFFNKPYGSLVEMYEKKNPHGVLLGLLENSGNSHVAKEKAIKHAQQTPNVSELVKNLQGVKELKFNCPRLGIGRDFVIREGSMAIVLENREAGGLGG